ncbi:MAG TPA: tellurite resistance TerB family protein [Polyangiaceae bacterium]|nr:tellurite resistance TerB family protein [Polyangiaceae bacterium]HYQ27434.1 tellurite resistance TerB family protein [Polyangiaceae bacterium]
MSGTDWHTLGELKLEALVEAMFLAAYADGEFSPVERAHFLKTAETLTDGRLATAQLAKMVADASEALEREGRQARLLSVKERLPDKGSRRVALSLAIQVTAADGVIRSSERELIFETAQVLEIDREETANLVRELSR